MKYLHDLLFAKKCVLSLKVLIMTKYIFLMQKIRMTYEQPPTPPATNKWAAPYPTHNHPVSSLLPHPQPLSQQPPTTPATTQWADPYPTRNQQVSSLLPHPQPTSEQTATPPATNKWAAPHHPTRNHPVNSPCPHLQRTIEQPEQPPHNPPSTICL
jgi:hypothetical protein